MSEPTESRGFRPSSRRRTRIAIGVVLGAIAIALNLVVYSSLDDSTEVLQATVDIPAGTQVTTDMFRPVKVSTDGSVLTVPADGAALVVGQYAKVRIVSGALLNAPSFQPEPLVSPGAAVVAITPGPGELPRGLRERSRVLLVIASNRPDDAVPATVDGRVVGLPLPVEDGIGTVSVSVEVDVASAALVAAADDVRIVLVEASTDPASDPSGEQAPASGSPAPNVVAEATVSTEAGG